MQTGVIIWQAWTSLIVPSWEMKAHYFRKVKNVMLRVDIDTETFYACSTQSAATSKAEMVGIFLVDIGKAANWSSHSALLDSITLR